MNNPVLDIIVTHYDEPLDVGKKFFDMLSLQRDVSFDDFRVILVQDGTENDAADIVSVFHGVPYRNIFVSTGVHAGVAAARNKGLYTATADWVMFCDFDDLFTNVCSLKLILNVLRDDETDIGWFETWREEKREKYFVNVLKENINCTFGKVYRRQALKKHGVMFDTRFAHQYESRFNSQLTSIIPPHRIKKINMPFAAYMKTLRTDGFNSRQLILPELVNEMVMENILNVADAVRTKNTQHIKSFVADTLCIGYFALNNKPCYVSDSVRKDFMEFVKATSKIISSIDISTMELAMQYAAIRTDQLVQRMFMCFGVEMMPPIDALDMAINWIHSINPDMQSQHTMPATNKHTNLPYARQSDSERVVVYCGTRNTYDCMVTSAKSLLSHTMVDHIYFLTEDDSFPQPLPDIITNINVSGQSFFSPDGPNFKNAWTYMCLMRGAFTKLLPQHDKILSLDIDVIVDDDISDLFDIDLSGYYLAGVHEPSREQPDYINFGAVLMNLDKLRADHLDDKIITALNTKYYDCPEQTCFSQLCAGHILLLPTEYNFTPHASITGDTDAPRMIHYAGVKYWKHYSHYRHFAEIPWSNLLHTDRHERVAAYIGTNNQYHMMLLSAKSLLANTHMDKVYFLIEEDSFPEELPDVIQCINVSNQTYFSKDGPNYNSPFSYMPMLRAAYPDMFKQHDRILSIDNDTIVEQDISALFETDMSNYYYAAALEARPGRKVEQPYFNTGVMLMNLQKMRQDGIDRKTINYLNEVHCLNDSQDALCVSCRDHILLIPSSYNACMFTAPTNNVFIRHFAGSGKPYFDQFAKPYDKPWNQLLRKE